MRSGEKLRFWPPIFSQRLFDRQEFAGVPEILEKAVSNAGGKVVRRNLGPDVLKVHLKQGIYYGAVFGTIDVMLIGIDGNEANIQERVGVNVWAIEMLKHLEGTRDKGQGIRESEKLNFLIYLSKPPLPDLPAETENWEYRVIGPGKFWTRWRLPLDLYLHRPRPDVFLSLSHYAPKWAPCPRVVCIMDLSFLKFGEAFKPAVLWQLTNWTRESVRNAARVITISEFNKQEIIKNYGCDDKKITVVYPGVSEIFKTFKGPAFGYKSRALDTGEGRTLRGKKYLLFVGTLQPKKNLGRLVEAFEIVRKRFPEIELVIAGKVWGQFTSEYLKAWPLVTKARPYQTPAGIKFLGFVPDQELPGLVAGAEALIIPSLYEGFGIPAVEAMSCETPVLASNVASLPEIVGDCGILFDPYDVKSIAKAIEQLLSLKPTDRQRLIEKGKIMAKEFDWDKTTKKVLDILKLVVRNSENG